MQDRRIKNEDVVIWHSFGVTHVPRVEDWPVMARESVSICAFQLQKPWAGACAPNVLGYTQRLTWHCYMALLADPRNSSLEGCSCKLGHFDQMLIPGAE